MTLQTYHGGCQCGAVAFDVDVDLAQTITCNCSRCKRMGFVLAFTPADNFRLTSGEDAQTDYRFNTGKIAHLFCSTCGVQSYGIGENDGARMVAINVNCLEGVDARGLASSAVDGASF